MNIALVMQKNPMKNHAILVGYTWLHPSSASSQDGSSRQSSGPKGHEVPWVHRVHRAARWKRRILGLSAGLEPPQFRNQTADVMNGIWTCHWNGNVMRDVMKKIYY